MSSHSRITDEEMKYFQFKAKQQLLIQKEDHAWNEFCKSKKCTCCSCQPFSVSQPHKDVGIQVAQKTPSYLSKNIDKKHVQSKDLPESLKDIKTMLEKIDISLSEIKQTSLKNVELVEPISSKNKVIENDSVLNFMIGQKKNLIKKSLMNSLQRLHSFANNRFSKPLSSSVVKSSNQSFFLPHDLQKQRVMARKAYLASLTDKSKLGIKEICPVKAKKNKVSFENKHIPPTSKQRSKKSIHITKPKEPETLIQLETTPYSKDENVENIVDNIVDDLLGDEILAFSRIKQKKAEMQHSEANKVGQGSDRKKEVCLSKVLQEARTSIKLNPFFDLKTDKKETIIKMPSNSSEHFKEVKMTVESTDVQQNVPNQAVVNTQDLYFNKEKSELKDQLAPKNYCIFTVDPELVKNVTRQRKLYWQYLNRISRTKTFNFDPCALSNMIAESLLDDCIIDVCEELGDVPASLIKDIINQEFIPTL